MNQVTGGSTQLGYRRNTTSLTVDDVRTVTSTASRCGNHLLGYLLLARLHIA